MWVAKLVRKSASSIAVSPPPTTTSSLPLKKNPSQVAQAETPFPLRRSSEGRPSQRAFAPVATMTASAWKLPRVPVCSRNGRRRKSTRVTLSSTTSVPKRTA